MRSVPVTVIVSLARSIMAKSGSTRITKVWVIRFNTSVYNVHVNTSTVTLIRVVAVPTFLIDAINTPRTHGILHRDGCHDWIIVNRDTLDVLECILQGVDVHTNGKTINNAVFVKNLGLTAVLQAVHQTAWFDALIEHNHVLTRNGTAHWFENPLDGSNAGGCRRGEEHEQKDVQDFHCFYLLTPLLRLVYLLSGRSKGLIVDEAMLIKVELREMWEHSSEDVKGKSKLIPFLRYCSEQAQQSTTFKIMSAMLDYSDLRVSASLTPLV
jgi:hypothetical protein